MYRVFHNHMTMTSYIVIRGLTGMPKAKLPEGLPGVGASEIASSFGIADSLFQQWLNRGIVPHQVVKHGNRTYRRFSLDDAAVIGMMAALYSEGFGPTEARDRARSIITLWSTTGVGEPRSRYILSSRRGARYMEEGDLRWDKPHALPLGADGVFLVVDVDWVQNTLFGVLESVLRTREYCPLEKAKLVKWLEDLAQPLGKVIKDSAKFGADLSQPAVEALQYLAKSGADLSQPAAVAKALKDFAKSRKRKSAE
jgi:hypothetical protein